MAILSVFKLSIFNVKRNILTSLFMLNQKQCSLFRKVVATWSWVSSVTVKGGYSREGMWKKWAEHSICAALQAGAGPEHSLQKALTG